MAIDQENGRRVYRPSGQVNWPRFLRWAAILMAVALAMAFVLNCFPLRIWGSFVIAVAVMTLLAAVGHAAIAFGNCRSQWAAIVLLEAAGVGFLAGCHVLAYLHPLEPKANAEPIAILHLLFFPYSFVAVLASFRATRAYCEKCGRWMRCQRVLVPAGTAASLAAALEDGTLSSFPAASAAGVAGRGEHAVVDLEYCPEGMDSESPCPAYLTLKEKNRQTKRAADKESDEIYLASLLHVAPGQQDLQYDPHTGARFVVRQIELSRLEMTLLAVKIPALIVAAASSKSTPADATAAATSRWAAMGTIVTSLPPGQTIEVHPFFRKLVYDLLSFTAVFLVLAGTTVAAWGYWERPWGGGMAGPAGWLAWLKLVSGGAAAMLGGFFCATNVEHFSRRYRYCWVREAIRQRGDRLVDPDDPEAIFVRIVPRAKWDMSGCHSDDMGFLRPDWNGRQLLFEGLRQRYRIPADALTYCAVEPVTYEGDANWLYPMYVTVIRAWPSLAPSDAPSLPWEAPLLPEPVDFQLHGRRHRYRRAVTLRDQIVNAMMGRPTLAGSAGASSVVAGE